MERVVDPILADLHREYDEAVRAGRAGRAAWIRVSGYAGFWKAIGFYALRSGPRSLANGIAADGWAVGRIMAFALIAFVVVTLTLSVFPFVETYSRMQHWLKPALSLLPQAMVLSIAIALSLGIVCGAPGIALGTRRIRYVLVLAAAASLMAFASVLIMPAANQAFRVAVAEESGMHDVTEDSLPRGMNELSFSELRQMSRGYAAGGFQEKARQFRQTFHIRLALPAATFVISLLALGICGTVRRRMVRVAALAAAIGVYYAMLHLSQSTPLVATLPAMLAVWTPNIVFTAVSLALLKVSSGGLAAGGATSEAGTS